MSHNVFAVPISVKFEVTVCRWAVASGGILRSDKIQDDSAIPVVPTFDAFAIRDQFMAIGTEADLLKFLQRTGVFSLQTGEALWTVEALLKWQQVFVQLLEKTPVKWSKIQADDLHLNLIGQYRDFHTRFVWSRGTAAKRNNPSGFMPSKHSAILSCKDTLGAILASIYVSHLMGAVYRFCRRGDCGKQFLLESAHERLYCSLDCAHVVAMRNHRARRKAGPKKEP